VPDYNSQVLHKTLIPHQLARGLFIQSHFISMLHYEQKCDDFNNIDSSMD